MSIPRVSRRVDGTLIRVPAYYGDHGGPGWYPELQYPTQSRLAVRWNPDLSRNVYIQPNALFLTGLKPSIAKTDLIDLLSRYGLGQGADLPFLRPHKHLKNVNIALVMFPSQHQAEDALIFCNEHPQLFDGPQWEFKARLSEINSNGHQAGNYDDILLVREEISLTPAYLPTYLLPDLSTANSSPGRWNAVGFARDAFAHKRKSIDYLHDTYQSTYEDYPRLHERGYVLGESLTQRDHRNLYDMPSPKRPRRLKPLSPSSVDGTYLSHDYSHYPCEDDPLLASKVRAPLSPRLLPNHECNYLIPPPKDYGAHATHQQSIPFFSGGGTLARSRTKGGKKKKTRSSSYDNKKCLVTGANRVVSAPGAVRMLRGAASAYGPRDLVPILSGPKAASTAHLAGDPHASLSLVLPFEPTSSRLEGDAQYSPGASQLQASNERCESIISLPNRIESNDYEVSGAASSEHLVMTPLSQLAPLDSPGEALENPPVPPLLQTHLASPPRSLLSSQEPSFSLPLKPTFNPASRLLYSHLEPFAHHFRSNAHPKYLEPRFIWLSPDSQTLGILRNIDNVKSAKDGQENIWAIEALTEDQRRLIGLEKKWVFTGPVGDIWRANKDGVVSFKASNA